MIRKLGRLKDTLFENIFNYAKGGIAIVGLNGEWIKVNHSVLEFLGYTERELYQKTFREITHKDDLGLDLNYMHELLSGDIENYQMDKRYFHKNGQIVWASLSVSLVRDVDKSPQYFISQIDDITDRVAYRSQLETMIDVVKEQNERLTSFTDIITHNLKTHVSNLGTLVSFLEEENESLGAVEDFCLLKGSVEHLSQTVVHLTEVAKIRAVNKSQLERLNLKEYIEHALYNISALAKNSNCTIENSISKDFYIQGIPAYLDSIILNFLTNAIKYASPNRDLVIKLSCTNENDYVVFSVEDNGLGIDLNKFGKKMFKMYNTFHKNKDATGIGLFITKNHIESLGGRVAVESAVDVGSKFIVNFKKSTAIEKIDV
ncbi:histidine kinase [Tamlana nanhaiensis]|uniref:histidine kinase n=1 Tax=Neotamlana nanhaiensis TaxID=1382798 RepID=A0A0D7W6J2_9FLAO|nr:HAMP domain-containing sensor histidine kinase [Tamlana nanhaiensis]KJD33442.1 histidine kinase [Tamlana nanhaiensis]